MRSKENLKKPDIYLKCACDIAADGEGKLVWQRNKKSAVFTEPLHPAFSNYLYSDSHLKSILNTSKLKIEMQIEMKWYIFLSVQQLRQIATLKRKLR